MKPLKSKAAGTQADFAGETWVRAGWLLDGRGLPARRDVWLGLRSGRIFKIEPFGEERRAAIDLSRATVLPLLIDAHVHLAFSGTENAAVRKEQLGYTPDQTRAAIRTNLAAHWHHGVAAVRDGGDRRGITLEFRQMAAGTTSAVVVKAAGAAWHAHGRYGTMIGQALPVGPPAQALQSDLAHCDHLKLIQSGLNSIDRFGHQGLPQFSQEALKAMVAAAHAAGRPVMVHANGETAVRMAIEAGCDSIEHGYFMGAENLRRLADKAIVWVPTIIPMVALSQAQGLTAAQREVAHRTVDHQLEQVRQAHRLGVRIVLGTDAGSQGVDHGTAVRRELQLLVMAGLRVEEAVSCSASHGARLLDLNDRGAIVPGCRGDLLAVNGPPEMLVTNLEKIEAMCIAGRWRDPEILPIP